MNLLNYYRTMPSKNRLLTLLILTLLIGIVRSPPPFCYINCSPTNCASGSASACQSCAPNYILSPASSPNPCVFNSALTTIKQSKRSTDFLVLPGPTGNCSIYTYWGEYGNNTQFNLTTSAIPEPHYRIELIAGLILIDTWPTGSFVTFKLISTGQTYQASQSNVSQNVNYCYLGANDGYARFAAIYTHTDTTNQIVWNAKTTYSHSSAKLGVRDLVVLTYLCHSWCPTCIGGLNTQCTSCIPTHFLSGTTCDTACLPGYGTNLPSNVCVQCHPFCLTCVTINTNCSTCKDTIIVGSNVTASQIYKVEDQYRCEVICPTGYYSHLASKLCKSCAIHCPNITITSALLNAGESLEFTYTFTEAMDWTGFNWVNVLNFNCTNTSLVTSTDFDYVYTPVDVLSFKIKLTPKPQKYLVASSVCTLVKPEAGNPLQFSQALNKLAPSVYTSFNCLVWSTPQVTMSISNVVDVPTKSIEWTFTFSGSMDFTGFVFTNFLFFNTTDGTNSITGNFTYIYTMVDTQNFKVKMTANPYVFFGNSTFCAVSKAEGSTTFQFSAQSYKLASSVYNQQSCEILYACHPYCLTCDGSPTNCPACGDTIIVGTNTTASQIYRVENSNACEVDCPLGYFAYSALKTCLSCSVHCVNMVISSQILSNGASLEFTYEFSEAIDFSAFDYTSFLSFTCTNASINTLTDFDIVQTIVNGNTFKLILTPKPTKYLVNQNFCTVIAPQSTNPYKKSIGLKQFNTIIYTMSSCIIWSTPQVNLTISNLINPVARYLEFMFTFTSSMEFTGFLYSDFVILNQSDTSITLASDFVITLTIVDDMSFKLRLTPNLGLYFDNALFCAVTNAQTLTALQFSKDWFKLNPSVYGQQNCITWTIPSVQLSITGQILFDAIAEFTFIFSLPMNFVGFNYLDFLKFSLNITDLTLTTNFTVNYTQANANSFKIIIQPAQNVQFKFLQICSITKPKSISSLHFSQDNSPLNLAVYGQSSCVVWSTQDPPAPFEYLKSLQELNNRMEEITSQKGTQQLIKSGVFALFFPGAQLSSTVLLHNPKINQNLYEGARFWGTFVYFSVPPYEQNLNRTKYIFESADKQIVQNYKQRRLQQQNSTRINNFVNEWKFDRTGHTGFFIFDTYIQLFLLGSAWILFVAGWIYEKKFNSGKTVVKINTRIMAIFHKIHEISLFYLVLGALIEFKNFDIDNKLHQISMIISVIVLLYFMIYELKIFYDMIDYPKAKLDSVQYQEFVKKYSFFIAYCRFEEYNVIIQLIKDKRPWNWRHFFRPYNYHTLTFVKKALMLSVIPLFYEHQLGPVVILMILQIMDVVRFLITIPYHKVWRNILYFTIEFLLLLFFMASLVNQCASLSIYDNDGIIVDTSYSSYYKSSGSLGIVLIFLYNILYALSSFAELIIILATKDSLQNMVWSNRNAYYNDLYDHFQKYGVYYRLVKHYTEELSYNRQRKVGKSFINWVNRFHDAEPIVDLSDQSIKIFKEVSDRGHIFASEYEEEQKKQNIIEIKIQSFKIHHFQRFVRLLEFEKSQFAPKNQDAMLKQETRSFQTYKGQIKGQEDTRSMKNLKTQNQEENIINFEIEYEIIPEIIKQEEKSKKRIKIPRKIKNRIHSDLLHPHFRRNLIRTLLSYQMPETEDIRLSTFLKINFGIYACGQRIAYRKQDMRQEIEIQRRGDRNKISLKQVMQGFPVDWQTLQKVKDNSLNQQTSSSTKALRRSRYGKDLVDI